MTIDLIAELADMFEEGALVAQPGGEDHAGNWVADGDPIVINAYISGGNRLVRAATGEESVSSVHAITAGFFNLDTVNFRYTIPSRYTPNEDLRAIAVEHYTDEDGPVAHQVFFP